ncbi:hypothetical protein AKJ16_DCAP00985 [Drosera capensis]
MYGGTPTAVNQQQWAHSLGSHTTSFNQLSSMLYAAFYISCFSNVSFAPSSTIKTGKRSLHVQAASSSNVERSSTAPAFVGGFILGGIVVGALDCVYAPQERVARKALEIKFIPSGDQLVDIFTKAATASQLAVCVQITKVLAADRKDLMRKVPKFIYDEEKALEKTRKILTEKFAELNSTIDDISTQLRSQDSPNGAAVSSDELADELPYESCLAVVGHDIHDQCHL